MSLTGPKNHVKYLFFQPSECLWWQFKAKTNRSQTMAAGLLTDCYNANGTIGRTGTISVYFSAPVRKFVNVIVVNFVSRQRRPRQCRRCRLLWLQHRWQCRRHQLLRRQQWHQRLRRRQRHQKLRHHQRHQRLRRRRDWLRFKADGIWFRGPLEVHFINFSFSLSVEVLLLASFRFLIQWKNLSVSLKRPSDHFLKYSDWLFSTN